MIEFPSRANISPDSQMAPNEIGGIIVSSNHYQ